MRTSNSNKRVPLGVDKYYDLSTPPNLFFFVPSSLLSTISTFDESFDISGFKYLSGMQSEILHVGNAGNLKTPSIPDLPFGLGFCFFLINADLPGLLHAWGIEVMYAMYYRKTHTHTHIHSANISIVINCYKAYFSNASAFPNWALSTSHF